MPIFSSEKEKLPSWHPLLFQISTPNPGSSIREAPSWQGWGAGIGQKAQNRIRIRRRQAHMALAELGDKPDKVPRVGAAPQPFPEQMASDS